jgi:hypothetical protein
MIATADAAAAVTLLKKHFFCRTDKLCVLMPWGGPCPTRGDHLLAGLLRAHVLGGNASRATAQWGPTAAGKSGVETGWFRCGTYCPGPDGTTAFGVLDFDGGSHHASPLHDPLAAALAVLAHSRQRGIPCYLEKSGGGQGWHLWYFFGPGCKARDVRALLSSLVPSGLPLGGKSTGVADPAKGAGIEAFPKSDALGSDPWSVGHQVWLPWYAGSRGGSNQFHQVENGKPTPYLPTAFETIDAAGLAAALASGVGPPPAPEPGAGPPFDQEGRGETSDATLAEVAEALEAIPNDPGVPYDDWLGFGMALRDLPSGSDTARFTAWLRWSEKSPKFKRAECVRKWTSFGRRSNGARVTVASIFAAARGTGWEPGPVVNVIPPPPPTNGPRVGTGQQQTATVGGTSEVWAEPIPFSAEVPVPAFPTSTLPGWMGEWARAVAKSIQVPSDLPGMLALGIASGGLSKKFLVSPLPGWKEQVNLYTAVMMQVGERKSAAFAAAIQPVIDFEVTERDRVALLRAARTVERGILEQVIRQQTQAARPAPGLPPNDAQRLAQQNAAAAAAQLAGLELPPRPRPLIGDCTPEALGLALMNQGGRVLAATDEGEVFANIAGRYSDSPRLELWLKGKSGGFYRNDRIGREAVDLDELWVSTAMAVQPSVFRALGADPTLRERGLPQRFALSVPTSMAGSRDLDTDAVPAEVAQGYHRGMTALWRLDTPKQPQVLTFTPEAGRHFRELRAWVEPQLKKGADTELMIGWLDKLPGDVARIAGVLHVADAVGSGTPAAVAAPIELGHVQAAVKLAREYLVPHASAAFELMGADQMAFDAQLVLERLLSNRECLTGDGPPRLNKRLLHQGLRSKFRTVAKLDPVLTLLEKHRYLREVPREPRAGRPSPEYYVHPRLVCAPPQNTQNTQNLGNGPPGPR